MLAESSKLPQWTTVGFSGHRKLENPLCVADGIRQALGLLKAKYGRLAAVSSAASGADTLFLEEVARRNLPCEVWLPSSHEVFKQDFSAADWERVQPFLDRALLVREVDGTQSRHEAFLETGVLTVEAADVMIFVWNGKPATGKGGTADVYSYARTLGKAVVVIDPVNGQIVIQDGFGEEVPKQAAASFDAENPRAAVESEFNELRKMAKRGAFSARKLILWIISLQLAAAALGVCLIAQIPGITHAGFLEPVLLAAATGLILWLHVVQHKWIDSRTKVELCRSFLAIWHFPRGRNFSPHMTIRGCEQLARSLRIAWLLDRRPPWSFEETRDRYLVNRIQEQLKFYRDGHKRARGKSKLFFRMAEFVAALALVTSVGEHVFDQTRWHVVSVILPIVAAALLTFLVAREYSRRSVLYEELALKLDHLRLRNEAARSWASLFRVVSETEDCLLREVEEWHSFTRSTSKLL